MSQTRVRFTVRDAEIVVRIADKPTSRDFVSMLPLTLNFSDFNAMEMISYHPAHADHPRLHRQRTRQRGSHLFIPWDNLSFFHNSVRRDASYDDQVIPIGTIETGYERLDQLESGPVRVERIR